MGSPHFVPILGTLGQVTSGGTGETPSQYRAISGKTRWFSSGGAAACPEPVEGSAGDGVRRFLLLLDDD
jgi:hypothetical protein